MEQIEPGPDHWLDNYGHCMLQSKCSCLKAKEWIGQLCCNWKPLGVKSLKELYDYQKKVRNEKRT